MLKGDYEQAEEDLKTCLEFKTSDTALAQEVDQEMIANKRRARAAEIKQKQTFKSFFDR